MTEYEQGFERAKELMIQRITSACVSFSNKHDLATDKTLKDQMYGSMRTARQLLTEISNIKM